MDGNGSRLSGREQRILVQIEMALGQDRRLERRLRTLRPGWRARCLDGTRRLRPWALGLLAVASVTLLVAAARTGDPVLIVAFAVSWAVTLALGFTAFCLWARRSRR
ncbi:MAG: hypothetical protein QOF84_4797 [Streptomyces sp.]|jgi:hypothetical protein|nr:hypothetical protein [Streptomyces sp.]